MYEITTASTKTVYHISVSEAKDHLGLVFSQNYDDAYIGRLIKAAHLECENYIQKDIALTSNVTSIWDFSGITIRIDKGHYNSITEIKDSNDVTYSIDATTLRIWPEFFEFDLSTAAVSDPLTFTYTTGFDNNACPELIKQAILMKLASYYDFERSNYTGGSFKDTQAAERLLNSYKSLGQLN
jgi:hypothetical protein